MAQDSARASYRRYQSPVVSHPGQLLREAREAAGIEQRDLAEELYLTLHYVQAIESGEFSRLPGVTFVRGYLRSYAKRMGIDEQRVLELYDDYLRDQTEQEGRSRRDGADAERWQRRIWLAMGMLLAVLVMLGTYSFITSESPSQPVEDAGRQEAEPPQSDHAGLTSNPDATAYPADEQDAVVERPAAIRVETRERSASRARAAEDGVVVAPPSVDRFEQRAGHLEMHFYADCWIQVKDASGTTLAFGVKRAGEALTLKGESPYSVRIGNVRGAKLTFNGDEVDLDAYAVNNTANFVLN